MAITPERQKRIMEHLARSSGNFIQPTSTMNDQRKKQIMDHIRFTKG
jgi:hypothetical protein